MKIRTSSQPTPTLMSAGNLPLHRFGTFRSPYNQEPVYVLRTLDNKFVLFGDTHPVVVKYGTNASDPAGMSLHDTEVELLPEEFALTLGGK